MGRLRITVGAFIAVLLLAAAGTFAFLYLRSSQVNGIEQFSTELRDGLVASCERNGNPLRDAVRKMIREQIQQSNSPAIKRYFPQIPAEELERLIRHQTEARRRTLHEIAPVNCEALYPPK
jgi:hypothetical protein